MKKHNMYSVDYVRSTGSGKFLKQIPAALLWSILFVLVETPPFENLTAQMSFQLKAGHEEFGAAT